MVDYRGSSYRKRASEMSASRSGYQNFPTTGGKVGSSSGDVLITEGKKEERFDSGIERNTVFQSSPSKTTVNEQGQLTQTSQTITQELSVTPQETQTQVGMIEGRRTTDPVSVSGGVYNLVYPNQAKDKNTYYFLQSQEKKPTERNETNIQNINDINKLNQGYIKATEEPKDTREKLKRIASEYEYKAFKSDSPILFEVKAAIASAGASFVYPFVNPKGFISDTLRFGKEVITNPFGVGYAVGEQAKTQSGSFVGELAGNYGLTKVPTVVKSGYVIVGSKYIPAEKVFDVGVLKGETVFPETTSTKQSLKEFNTPTDNKIIVQTSSPAKISGDVAGVGKKASLGIEDPGIYVTPLGRGSPVFTGVFGNAGYDFSLNPFKGSLGVPSVTRFEVQKVVQYPRGVINQPGFKSVSEYQQSVLAYQKVAVITKRSEIGQGTVPSKGYGGTKEIEAVIPVDAKFEYTPKSSLGKFKGFDEYTTLNGRPVAIRDTKLVGKGQTSPGKIIISERVVKSGSESLSNLRSKRISPVPGGVSSIYNSQKYSSSELSSSVGSSVKSNVDSRVISSSSKVSSVGSSVKSNVDSRVISSSSKVSSVGSSVKSNVDSRVISVKSSAGSSIKDSSYSYIPLDNPPPPTKPNNFQFRKDNNFRNVYGVQVKSRGSFKTLNTGLNLKDAIRLGESRVGQTSARTFRITRNNQVVKGLSSNNFYNKGGSLIEKSKYAINTPGERDEISYVGIRSLRRGK